MLSLTQHIATEHPLLWLLVQHPWLSEEHKAMNLLQKFGVISDNAVHIEDVALTDQQAGVSWLCSNLGLTNTTTKTRSAFPAGPKPGKETETWKLTI